MIDLSRLNTVDVNPDKARAYAKGGALLNALDTAAREHGMITTAGVVSHTGVGGYTLGGGFGRLNRKFGLTIDNLVSAEIITADGEVRRVSAEQDPDLFWAIAAVAATSVSSPSSSSSCTRSSTRSCAASAHGPIDQAREVLDFYGDWSRDLSDDLYVGPAMMTMPDGQGVVAMEVVYAGYPGDGDKELAPLLEIGTPIDNGVGLNDYMAMQTQEDALVPHGIRSYAKSGMVGELSSDFIDAMVRAYRADPRLAFFTHTAGGAVSRVDELATAFPASQRRNNARVHRLLDRTGPGR